MEHLNTESLTRFGLWLLSSGNFGHGLLVLHGCQMGFKLKDQLNLRWKDFINENEEVNNFVQVKGDIKRYINPFVELVTKEVFEKINPKKILSKSPYIKKNNSIISNHNLKVELNRYYKRWLKNEKAISKSFYIKISSDSQNQSIRSQDFEHAWARDFLCNNQYDIEAFKILSRAMKHKSLEYTINLYGVSPLKKPVEYKFEFDYNMPQGFFNDKSQKAFIIEGKIESENLIVKLNEILKNQITKKI
jgi:hypothetical protein